MIATFRLHTSLRAGHDDRGIVATQRGIPARFLAVSRRGEGTVE